MSQRRKDWEYFAARLRYEPAAGHLIWLDRPRAHFKTERGWRGFNSKHAGKPTRGGLTNGYNTVRIEGALYYTHRICWMLHNKSDIPARMVIDHIDSNTTNNCASNIRVATHAENGANQKPKQERALPKCVFYDKTREQFVGWVVKNRKPHFVGRFQTSEAAAEAVAASRATLHGRFARG